MVNLSPFLSVFKAFSIFIPSTSLEIWEFKLSLKSWIVSSLFFNNFSICWFSKKIALSSFSKPCLVKTLTSITVPLKTPGDTYNDVSFTSDAFSPNITFKSFSSGVDGASLFGVVLPTNISPALISAPICIIPLSSSFLKTSSPTFGISLVISSGPNLVSLATTSNSSIWTDVNTSSLTNLSEITIESAKL